MAHLNDFALYAEVGDDTDTKCADAAVVCYDHFGYGAHTYGVATEDVVHFVFSGSLESRTLSSEVHTFLYFDALFLGNLASHLQELLVVSFAHIWETWTSGEVWSVQGMFGHEVDVVGDEHQVADFEVGIHTSGSIAYEELFDAEFVHHTYGEGDFLHIIAFVIVEAAFERHDFLATQTTEYEAAAVTFDSRNGEVGDFAIRECIDYFDFCCQTAEACAQDDGSLWTRRSVLLNPFCCLLNFL